MLWKYNILLYFIRTGAQYNIGSESDKTYTYNFEIHLMKHFDLRLGTPGEKNTNLWKYLKIRTTHYASQYSNWLQTSLIKKKKQPRLEDVWQKNLESKCKFMEMVTDCHMEVGGGWCCSEWWTIWQWESKSHIKVVTVVLPAFFKSTGRKVPRYLHISQHFERLKIGQNNDS